MLTRMRFAHSIRAGLLALAIAGTLLHAAPRAQAPVSSTFTVFLRSAAVGSEQVAVERTDSGWTISGSGRLGPPVDLIARAVEARYDSEWKPLELTVDATLRGQSTLVHTTVTGPTATTESTLFGEAPIVTTDQIRPGSVLMPIPFVAPYEALAAQLKGAAPGTVLALYQPAQGSYELEVGESSTQRIRTVQRTIVARRTLGTFRFPSSQPIGVEIWGDENGRLLRVSIPVQGLEFAREDVSSVGARLITMSRPNDEDIRIPANGFSLAGTVSKPANAAGRLPAVVLIGGSDSSDRDETSFGVPVFGQMAHALADAGFVVLRYDRRGAGESGGRAEAAALGDFAEDARAAVKVICDRKDVDRNRVAVVGYGEGGWVAMMTAAGNGRVSAVGLVATVAATGRELNLYQVTHGLERSNRPQAEQQATIDLQKKIQDAVVTGAGWDQIGLADSVKRQADTPYFQSFLTFDPARLLKDVRQPLLIVQGERDPQVPPASADRLEALAKARKKSATVDVVKVAGINHLLVPATTGESDEYVRLSEHQVSAAVTSALDAWLKRSLSAPR